MDPYLALIEGQSYTAEWAIYLLDETVVQPEVQWEFTNRPVEIPVSNRDSARENSDGVLRTPPSVFSRGGSLSTAFYFMLTRANN